MSDRLGNPHRRCDKTGPYDAIDPTQIRRATVSPQMLRALHAAAARRGFTHDDLRVFAGVTSLTQLTADAARRVLDRLNEDRPQRSTRLRERRTPRGTIRRASEAQRAYIRRLFGALGWSAVARVAFLHNHGIADLDCGDFTTVTASRCITQLQAAQRNPRGNTRRSAT